MFIPIGDDQDHDRTPWATRALLAANLVVFALCLPRPSDRVLLAYALNAHDLRPLQFFTHLFLHADLWHVAGNMVFLWTFGRLVEERLGSFGYAAFYLVCGLGSAVLHLVAEKDAGLSFGASGAVAGMMGACLVFCPRAHIKLLYWFFFIGVAHVAIYVWSLIYIATQVLFAGFGRGSTAYWGHIGGFIVGYGAAWILREVAARRIRPRGPPLEPRERETRRPFQLAEEDEPVFLDDAVDAFAVVCLEKPPEGAPRSGVLARRLPRAEAEARRKELGTSAALIADQPANDPPPPKPVDAASWDDRMIRFRVGIDVVPLPWKSIGLVVDATLGAERFLDVFVSRTTAYRVPARPGVGLTRVDPARRQEEASTLDGLAKAFEERRGAPCAGGSFDDPGQHADYVFRAWHLARAGRAVPPA
ncbi:MAG TPA: rhomboid family intramembrane serine protease [Planctomycetota bacterium]